MRRHPKLEDWRGEAFVTTLYMLDDDAYDEKYWFEADILATHAKCMRYNEDIRLNKPGAKKAYEDFKAARYRYMKLVQEHVQKVYDHGEALKRKREEEINDRFGKLGYSKSTIRRGIKCSLDRGLINYLTQCISRLKLIDADWQRIRFAHEPNIALWYCRELQYSHGVVIDARVKLVESVYDDYKRTLRPIEWLRLPPVGAVCMVPSVRDLVFKDFDTTLDRARCEETLRILPDVISAYLTSVKVLSLRALGETVQLQDAVANWPAGADDRLALATSVFSYYDGGHAISYNGLLARLSELGADILEPRSWLVEESISTRLLDARYHCESEYLPRLDSRGRSITIGLATALGLDPDTARPEDFDALDRRFFCRSEACLRKFIAMSWRDAVFHKDPSSETYCISMLDEASSAAVRANDGTHYAETKAWSCNHCCAHLNDWQSQAHVIEHVLRSHAVADPMNHVDYIRALAPVYDYRQPLRGENVSPVDVTYQDIAIELPEDDAKDEFVGWEAVDWNPII
ncbi:hypothetical protein FOMPIDRAFT_89701 [Fomitopsis schrenkii]|uniref:Uncharacterized protein n=1 Tax=Fomitopsis schrenkii TaxID=2126942 RepID=S8EAD8_FOMSC|nr:hypothetical protein FOMPIDRAFT_89701 [Fomitopsis schrenkii]